MLSRVGGTRGTGGLTTCDSAAFHLLKTLVAMSWATSSGSGSGSFSSAIAASSISPSSVSPRMLRKIV